MINQKNPKKLNELETLEISINVTKAWIRVIRFCEASLRHGQICFKVKDAQPTDLVPEYTKRRIRFDKEEQVPEGFEIDQFSFNE